MVFSATLGLLVGLGIFLLAGVIAFIYHAIKNRQKDDKVPVNFYPAKTPYELDYSRVWQKEFSKNMSCEKVRYLIAEKHKISPSAIDNPEKSNGFDKFNDFDTIEDVYKENHSVTFNANIINY